MTKAKTKAKSKAKDKKETADISSKAEDKKNKQSKTAERNTADKTNVTAKKKKEVSEEKNIPKKTSSKKQNNKTSNNKDVISKNTKEKLEQTVEQEQEKQAESTLEIEQNTEVDITSEIDERAVTIDQKSELKQIIQGILLTANKPLTEKHILSMLEEENLPEIDDIKKVIKELQDDLEGSGIELKRVASGFEMQVRARYARYVAKMWEERPPKYSRALFETLALIAYKQPITRGEIEEVRGVAISTSIFKTLLEDRNWIRVVGHRDVPGRPALYATTKQFLDYFNVKGLEDLPSLPEIAKLNSNSEQAKDNLELELEHEVEKQHEEHEHQEQANLVENAEDDTSNTSHEAVNNELSKEQDLGSDIDTMNESVINADISDEVDSNNYNYDDFSEVVAVAEKSTNKDSEKKSESKTLADIAAKYENLF